MNTCFRVKDAEWLCFFLQLQTEQGNNYEAIMLKPWWNWIYSLQNYTRCLWCNSSFKTRAVQKNMRMWTLCSGVCEMAAVIRLGDFFPPVSRKPTASDASDRQSKRVCVCLCVCLLKSPQPTYCVCLRVLHTIKSMWLIVSASVLFIQKVTTK